MTIFLSLAFLYSAYCFLSSGFVISKSARLNGFASTLPRFALLPDPDGVAVWK